MCLFYNIRAVVVVMLELQLPMQSVPIATISASSNPAQSGCT